MNALSGLILVTLAVGILTLSRRGAMLAMIVGVLFLAQGASIQFAGSNLFPTRILTYLCFLRVFIRRELWAIRFTKMDKALLLLYSFSTVVLILRSPDSIPLDLAKLLDVALGYFSFRALIRTPDDFEWLLRATAILLVPYVLLLGMESATRSNPFAYVGGTTAIWIRDNSIRCFGSFRHPSLLGSLGAAFFPLFVALFWNPKLRLQGIIGAVLCVGVVAFSNSGGPLSALASGVLGWLLWPFRMRMRSLRRCLVGALLILNLIMTAPIWYILARLSSVTGGSGWHRSYLIDVAVQHIDLWWFAGMRIEDTHGWFPYVLAATGAADITNEFISFGLQAGILAIALFILLLYRAYSNIGAALDKVRKLRLGSEYHEHLLWGLGVMLMVHISNWLGITYFDQFNTVWMLHAAAICSLSQFWIMQDPEPRIAEVAAPLQEMDIKQSFAPGTTY